MATSVVPLPGSKNLVVGTWVLGPSGRRGSWLIGSRSVAEAWLFGTWDFGGPWRTRLRLISRIPDQLVESSSNIFSSKIVAEYYPKNGNFSYFDNLLGR